LSHIWPDLFPNSLFDFPGHHAVIVFFVLSGFVISYTTDRKDRTFGVYVINRLTRLWSVVIPALLLGALIIPIVAGNPVSDAPPSPLGLAVSTGIRSALNLFFVSEFWGLDKTPPFQLALLVDIV
jgi:peptidoglycan/LPS O-acetylase OafA/YrhL